jgi:hypothetical protein
MMMTSTEDRGWERAAPRTWIRSRSIHGAVLEACIWDLYGWHYCLSLTGEQGRTLRSGTFDAQHEDEARTRAEILLEHWFGYLDW